MCNAKERNETLVEYYKEYLFGRETLICAAESENIGIKMVDLVSLSPPFVCLNCCNGERCAQSREVDDCSCNHRKQYRSSESQTRCMIGQLRKTFESVVGKGRLKQSMFARFSVRNAL